MSALEQKLLDQLLRLDEAARRRVVQAAVESLSVEPEQTSDWLDDMRTIRAEMRTKYGKFQFSVIDLLNEVREERLNDLMDRY